MIKVKSNYDFEKEWTRTSIQYNTKDNIILGSYLMEIDKETRAILWCEDMDLIYDMFKMNILEQIKE